MDLIRPQRVRLEASTYCQLKCPLCPTASGEVHREIGKGFLRFHDFRKLLEENPQISEIELSNWGEIFLNKELAKIMEYAFQRNIVLNAQNGANLNNMSEKILEALVKFRFGTLTCSLDGATEDVYRRYRVNGNLSRVIDNIKKINKFKQIYSSPFPILKWQFVIFGHNQHEVDKAQEMAAYLGMQFVPKLSWDCTFSPVKNADLLINLLGATSSEEYARKRGKGFSRAMCYQLWNDPQINWDGRIFGCCGNFWKDFGGNAFRQGLVPSLNSEAIKYARRMLMGKTHSREDVACSSCSKYRSMRKEGNWVTTNEILLDSMIKSSVGQRLSHNRVAKSIWRAMKKVASQIGISRF